MSKPQYNYQHGYNETRGGDGGEMSEDVKKRISETLKRKFESGEIKVSKKSDEGLKSLSESKMGNSWNKGRKQSEEQVRKRVESTNKTKALKRKLKEEKFAPYVI